MSWQPAETRAAWLDDLPPDESRELEWFWPYWARPAQQPPSGAWHIWLVMAGRGFGKTRTGAEWVREQVEISGRRRIALVAETAADAREVMVEGPAGILASSRTDWRPKYEPSKRRLTWPNGAIATTYSADKPGQLRGPQHDAAWADELAKWRYPDETWSNLMFGLRMGDDPRCVVTTTPRPIAIIRDLLARKATGDVVVTTGSTYENAVNLAPPFLSEIIRKYEGTRLGRQELLAELLTDTPGALWTLAGLDATRVPASPDLSRVVVAIDPAATSGEDADETGIIVAGKGIDGHGYVLADLTCRLSPDGWARRAVAAYHEYKADRIVAEVNNGGEMVGHTIRTIDRHVPYKAITATRGKRLRAEPVAAKYEQGAVHHVGSHPALEDQMTSFTPDTLDSPDRVDALVWALTDLLITAPGTWRAV